MKTELLGGISGSVDAPAALLEHELDVATLHDVERCLARRYARLSAFETFVENERVARGADKSPLDHVLKLADVTRPVVFLQSRHGLRRHARDRPAERLLPLVDDV